MVHLIVPCVLLTMWPTEKGSNFGTVLSELEKGLIVSPHRKMARELKWTIFDLQRWNVESLSNLNTESDLKMYNSILLSIMKKDNSSNGYQSEWSNWSVNVQIDETKAWEFPANISTCQLFDKFIQFYWMTLPFHFQFINDFWSISWQSCCISEIVKWIGAHTHIYAYVTWKRKWNQQTVPIWCASLCWRLRPREVTKEKKYTMKKQKAQHQTQKQIN